MYVFCNSKSQKKWKNSSKKYIFFWWFTFILNVGRTNSETSIGSCTITLLKIMTWFFFIFCKVLNLQFVEHWNYTDVIVQQRWIINIPSVIQDDPFFICLFLDVLRVSRTDFWFGWELSQNQLLYKRNEFNGTNSTLMENFSQYLQSQKWLVYFWQSWKLKEKVLKSKSVNQKIQKYLYTSSFHKNRIGTIFQIFATIHSEFKIFRIKLFRA